MMGKLRVCWKKDDGVRYVIEGEMDGADIKITFNTEFFNGNASGQAVLMERKQARVLVKMLNDLLETP